MISRRNTHIFTHNMASQGSAELAEALGVLRIKRENSRYRGREGKTVINWGASALTEEVLKSRVINTPDAVRSCSNKLQFFTAITAANLDTIPEWTSDFDTALSWVEEGIVVVARTVLNGHSGEGIVIMERDKPETLVRAPLYVKYVKKLDEYRIHVAFGEIIDFQKKVLSEEKRNSGEEVNFKVRNLANGFIFQRGGVELPEDVMNSSMRTIEAVGLDFGAVDVIYNRRQNKAYVLEINTAPGLQGQTIESYANAFRNNL